MPTPPIPPAPTFRSAPNIAPPPSFSSAPTLEDKPRSPKESEHRSRKERPHKERRRSPSSRHSRKRSRSPDRSSHSKRSRQSEPERGKEKDRGKSSKSSSSYVDGGRIFYIDKKGDKDAFFYGETNRSDIPTYRRSGGGRVLGMPRWLKIDHASAKAGKVLVIVNSRKEKRVQRYMDSKYTWMETDKAFKRVNLNPESMKHTMAGDSVDYITLDDEIKLTEEHKATNANDAVEAEPNEVDYRSIETPKKPQDVVEVKEEQEESIGESFEEYAKRRTIELNRQLDKEPNNAKLWLSFIAFQDTASAGLNSAAGGTTAKSKATKASLAEVKLSIFEKALQKNPGCEELLLPYMRCASEIWDTKTILTKWDSVLRENTNSISLWTEYVNFRQTSFSSFTFQQCLQVFEECLSGLRNIVRRLENDKSRDTFAEREDAESIMIYIFLRCCLFLKQSGYIERAFGCFQAIMEINLFPPRIFTMQNLQITFSEMLMEFEMFWDSEVPRFGEQGAKGWQEFYRAKSNGESPSDIPKGYSVENNDTGVGFDEWVSIEKKKDYNRRTPLRINNTQAEDIDEDPYVIVMFDDIRPLMFQLKTRQNLQHLMYTFFTFLNLPYIPPQISTNTPFTTDTFTHNHLAGPVLSQKFWPPTSHDTSRLLTYIDGIAMEPERQTGSPTPFGVPSCSFPIGVDELFAKHDQWFSCTPQYRLDSDVDINFVRNAFDQLLAVSDDQHLRLCYLSFNSSVNIKWGAKLAKSLLKDDRNNLILWNAYAQHEKSHNNITEARKVYHTALSMLSGLNTAERANAPLLFRMLAELEFDLDHLEVALNILLSMAEDVPRLHDESVPTTTQVLKARNFFAQKISYLTTLAVTEHDYHNAYQYFVCQGLFEYLTQGVEAACDVFEGLWKYYTDRGVERSIDNEMLLVAYGRMLYRHSSKRGGYKPSVMRDMLTRSLELFPNNTILLSLFMWNEARTKIENRVRQHLNQAIERDPNYVLWEFAIYSELHHHVPYNPNMVRSLLERAVECPRTRSSIALWKIYIEYELREGNHDRAKVVFYRAIRECPWAKDLYLMAFDVLYHEMNEQELHQILSSMMEKELRIRTAAEAFMDMEEF
ncbi:NRDE-2, necessary for RNA interference-domain-containing protein [Umbelopsis sp. AD052]|nr:NRDE-2, necessary for RNA interference-domain-containing protein [Umbelopsis sp. AD052]